MNITAQMLREAFQQTQREILANQTAHATRWERMAEVLNERLERIGDKLVEVETALDRLRLASKDEVKE